MATVSWGCQLHSMSLEWRKSYVQSWNGRLVECFVQGEKESADLESTVKGQRKMRKRDKAEYPHRMLKGKH